MAAALSALLVSSSPRLMVTRCFLVIRRINSLRPQVEKLPYTTDDFKAVARINYSPAVFVARADAPFADLKGMVAYAKENPDKLVYSNDNKNGFTYTVFEMAGIQNRYRNERQSVSWRRRAGYGEVLGGETMAYAGAPSVVGEHIKSGKLKGICTTD